MSKATEIIETLIEYGGNPQKNWPGFKRVGGKLIGPMPYGFEVVKSSRQFKAGEDWVHDGEARHGSVKYVSMDSGKSVWLDADDINLNKGIIPYGIFG